MAKDPRFFGVAVHYKSQLKILARNLHMLNASNAFMLWRQAHHGAVATAEHCLVLRCPSKHPAKPCIWSVLRAAFFGITVVSFMISDSIWHVFDHRASPCHRAVTRQRSGRPKV